jgi:5-methylcytosine-specific restriction endonuclease McrA
MASAYRQELVRTSKPWIAREWRHGKRIASARGGTKEEALARLADKLQHLPPLSPSVPRPTRRRLVAVNRQAKEVFPERFRRAIKARDGRCVGDGRYWDGCDGTYPLEYCQVDHIDPDGPHSMENGQTLCQNCHGVKCAQEREAARAEW